MTIDADGDAGRKRDTTLLDDIVVVEHGGRIAAGACGTLLAQLGARVIVIEPPAPSSSGKWRSRASMMVGKESIVIERNDAVDRALEARLLDECDVLLLGSDFPAVDGSLTCALKPMKQCPDDFYCNTTLNKCVLGSAAGTGGVRPTARCRDVLPCCGVSADGSGCGQAGAAHPAAAGQGRQCRTAGDGAGPARSKPLRQAWAEQPGVAPEGPRLHADWATARPAPGSG